MDQWTLDILHELLEDMRLFAGDNADLLLALDSVEEALNAITPEEDD